jgi:hypothetical protein
MLNWEGHTRSRHYGLLKAHYFRMSGRTVKDEKFPGSGYLASRPRIETIISKIQSANR